MDKSPFRPRVAREPTALPGAYKFRRLRRGRLHVDKRQSPTPEKPLPATGLR